MLLSAEQISKTYGTRKVLDRVSLYLEAGQKLGVIGVNGTGKSTLLRILAGAEEPDEGRVSRDPNVRLNYLPQLPAFDEKNTVLEQVFAGVSPEARALAEYEAKTILTRLGVPLFEQRVGVLSGGQRKRVALCSALACPCDVLILDEPTNHLDSGMVAWLEDELRQFKGALVMVTHDRYFLERVVGRMAEVEGPLPFMRATTTSTWNRRRCGRRWPRPANASGRPSCAESTNGSCRAPPPGGPRAGSVWNGTKPSKVSPARRSGRRWSSPPSLPAWGKRR